MKATENMDGWTYDTVLMEWSFPFLRYTYEGGFQSTSSLVVGIEGARVDDGDERGQDYESYAVIPGRFEHALGCFMAAQDIGAQRLWWLALDTMGLYELQPDFQGYMTAAGRAWELGLMTVSETIEKYRTLHVCGATTFPAHRLDELMYLCICSAPWELDEEGETSDYIDGYQAMSVDMMKQIHPEAAAGLELFRGQIYSAFQEMKFNEPAARRYVVEMVEGQAERFDLPDLE